MFEALSDRLAAVLKKISGSGTLRPEDVDAGLREVRLALLEADVNFKVVKEFVERVRARLVGTETAPGLTAPQQVVKAVNAELGELLGVHRFDDLLWGGQARRSLGSHKARTDPLDELLDHLEVDVGLEQG